MSKIKHLLSLNDLNKSQINEILERAKKLKSMQKKGKEQGSVLKGKTLAMIFEKPSNRTRVSFEVGMFQLGGLALNIQASEIKMGIRETVQDIALTLSRFVDGVMIRSNDHKDLVEFAIYATVPVINGLSDKYHPCQILADILTITEKKGKIKGLKVCYIGDGNNVCRSLFLASKILGFDFVLSSPAGYELEELLSENVKDPKKAVLGADVIYTDVWTSMGQEAENEQRKKDFAGYTVSNDLVKLAKPDCLVMHCLPAHRGEEISADVMESPQSVVFDQAENRLHAQKAVLNYLLGKKY